MIKSYHTLQQSKKMLEKQIIQLNQQVMSVFNGLPDEIKKQIFPS